MFMFRTTIHLHLRYTLKILLSSVFQLLTGISIDFDA